MSRRIVLTSDDGGDRPPDEDLTIDYAGELNDQQYAAATAGGGPVLIVAGAGTGKTRTLIYRMAYLVETGTKPENVVLLTFTRRSAREMTTRAARLLDGRCERVKGGTFHAFCLNVLRRHANAVGFPRNFTVLDTADAADVLSVLRTRGAYAEGEERFPQKKTLYSMFSAVTNRNEPLDEVLARRYPQFSHLHDDLQQLRREYQQYKKSHALMDFDDLLLRTLELFNENDAVRRQVAKRCRHVLVDEYQDTNALQAALVRAFASVHGNVTVVGDDAQSIYRFRGADFRNIFRFPEHFDDCEVLKLERNYRSTQPILDLANHVIDRADRSYDKTLFTDQEEGELPGLVQAEDEDQEAEFVGHVVHQLREEGISLSRIAVLFRNSRDAYRVERELDRRNIPFVKYGGTKFNETAHVKDVLSHLKVAENLRDAAAWNRILQLVKGIGPKTSRRLIEWITGRVSVEDEEADDGTVEANTATLRIDDPDDFSKRYLSGLRRLLTTLRSIRDHQASVVEQVETVIDYYRPIFEREYEDSQEREPDLDHLVSLVQSYDSREKLLSELALDPIEQTAVDHEESEDDEPPLVLSTIHSAKGTEFHTVFLIRALEGSLPSSYALKDEGDLDEELRLLYVAITRAKQDLFISYPITRDQGFRGGYMTKPSRFIRDVPEEILEPVQLVEEDAADPLDAPDDPKALTDGSGEPSGDAASDEAETAPGADPSAWDAEDELDDALPF